MRSVALVLSAVALLGGCVVRVASPPPPPRVYVQPPAPAPAYVEPAVDVEARATEPPPPLPDYEQPPAPDEGYLWTPGYWAWGGGGYYWLVDQIGQIRKYAQANNDEEINDIVRTVAILMNLPPTTHAR